MERQRSFQLKPPTRFMLFFFTVSASFIFLIFFFIFVIKLSPSFNQETEFEFNDSSISFPIIQTLAAKTANLEVGKPIFSAGNVSKISQVSLVEESEDFEVKNSILGDRNVSKISKVSLDEESGDFEVKNPILSVEGVSKISQVSLEEESGDFEVKNLILGDRNVSKISQVILEEESEDFDVENSILGVEGVSKMSVEMESENIEVAAEDAVRKDEILKSGFGDDSRKDQDFDVEEVKGRGTSVGVDDGSSEGLSGEVLSSVEDEVEIQEKSVRSCDFTRGVWVFDESYPLYTNASCPFIDEGFDCLGNGRLDREYMKWRWQPQGCDLPRFNATKMLELIRGKRLVFVGDSVNRNQWESLLCMLMGAIKDPKKVYETRGRRITKGKGNYSFKFVDYKCTVEFYVTHFLVHESKARIGRKRVQTLRIDTIDRGSSRWRGADILVFNTAHWWNHQKTKSGINYYQEKDQVLPRLDVTDAFRRALLTWASWVDKNIRSQRTQVFFRSSAPSHFSGGQWNSGGHCKEASRPLDIISDTHYPERNKVVEAIISQMRTPVTYLNITSLSDYRIDGHPSIYGRMAGKSYSSGGQDCSHWCLPGVPDTWNQILYSHLLFKGREGST